MNDSNSAVSATSALATAKDYFASLQTVLLQLDLSVIDHMTETVWKNYEEDRTLYIFGNGGSAALASHLACDFGKGTVAANRRRLRTVSLADNVALMTALANDLAYQDIFSEQLAGLATTGSGNSPNVVRGLEEARRIGLKTLAITGFSGGRVKNLADLCLVVPSDNMQHIEDVHLFATHAIFRALRYRMTLPKA